MVTYCCEQCKTEVETSECHLCGGRTTSTSKLYWCEHCNIPIYNEVCPLCRSKAKYFAVDVRPVFPEERLLIEIILDIPYEFVNASVWCSSSGRYFVDGKPLTISLEKRREKAPDEIREKINQYSGNNKYEAFDKYKSLFVEANKSRCNYITNEAFEYVQKMARGKDNGEMFVSFSGGKDSTVVSSLVMRALSEPRITHLFGDTTLEYKDTLDYIDRFKAANPMTPVRKVRNNEQDFYELCKTFGPPSRLLRWCCTTFKTGFIGQKIQRLYKGQNQVLTFYGIRRKESNSRSKYERESQSPKISKQKVCSPIIDWYDFDIWLYLFSNDIIYNEAYKKGFTRVGCWCCPNNTKWAQILAAIYSPEESNKFNNMLYEFATKMGKTDPNEYILNGGWKARQGGDGMDLSQNVAISFKPCATDNKSFDYELKKPISSDLYEFFKPFGILNFEMGNKRLGEVYILEARKKTPILKLQGRDGSTHLRITILDLPIAARTKLLEVELKFKCQLTKFQLCQGCHACETACRHNAVTLTKTNSGASNTYRYTIDENICVHCFECINHYDGGCYMKRVLQPRGVNYVRSDKTQI